jgi:hypothetical protein
MLGFHEHPLDDPDTMFSASGAPKLQRSLHE